MPNADDISRSIAPGSLPYGERQEVAGNLQAALGGAAGQGAGPAPVAEEAGDPVDAEIDPMERLLAGEHSSDLPITSGLSEGPGSTGLRTKDETPKVERLRAVAMHAKSPVLRYQARAALRREMRRAQ